MHKPVTKAREFLIDYFMEHESADARIVLDLAESLGHNRTTLRKQRAFLSIKTTFVGYGKNGKWVWTRPQYWVKNEIMPPEL